MILQIPPDAEVHELTNSVVWFDKDGILYSVSKQTQADFTDEEILSEMEKLRAVIGNRKVCLVTETQTGNAKPPKKEQRALIAREIASITKAMAIITTSSLNKMIVNLFFGFAPPQYPVKMFRSEAEAKEWIKQYL